MNKFGPDYVIGHVTCTLDNATWWCEVASGVAIGGRQYGLGCPEPSRIKKKKPGEVVTWSTRLNFLSGFRI